MSKRWILENEFVRKETANLLGGALRTSWGTNDPKNHPLCLGGGFFFGVLHRFLDVTNIKADGYGYDDDSNG